MVRKAAIKLFSTGFTELTKRDKGVSPIVDKSLHRRPERHVSDYVDPQR